tara:strand:+ start:602 stop:910 length:309 start_codon:yes stop_codon:yes gene_type:complete
MKPIIIEGYKGVMPLDLTLVDQKYHKIMIAQHEEDIKEYNRYQQSLPLRLQYENTIDKALTQINNEQDITRQLANVKLLEQHERDQLYHEQQKKYINSITNS